MASRLRKRWAVENRASRAYLCIRGSVCHLGAHARSDELRATDTFLPAGGSAAKTKKSTGLRLLFGVTLLAASDVNPVAAEGGGGP